MMRGTTHIKIEQKKMFKILELVFVSAVFIYLFVYLFIFRFYPVPHHKYVTVFCFEAFL